MQRAALVLACAVLAACGSKSFIESHSSPAIAGLERASEGAFHAGQVENLRLVYSVGDTESAEIRWSASGGALVTHGAQAEWTLPDADEATLTATVATSKELSTSTFRFRLSGSSTAPLAAASGVVDGSPDTTGSACDLGFRPDGTPAIAYRNDRHPGLWYATWNGTAWQTQLVDGMGYEVGGAIAQELQLAIAADGTPHIVYALANSQVFYATKTGAGAWVRERVDGTIARNTSSSYRRIGIALDPAHGNRPTVAYSSASYLTVIAARTAPGTWSNTALGISSNQTYEYFEGGLGIAANGTMYYTTNSGGLRVASWPGTGSTVTGVSLTNSLGALGGSDGFIPLALDGNGTPLALGHNVVAHAVPGSSGLANGVLTLSPYEETGSYVGDIAWANGKPLLAYGHAGSTTLEIATTAAGGYWVYTTIGTFTSTMAHLGVAADSAGVGHVCFQADSKVQYQ